VVAKPDERGAAEIATPGCLGHHTKDYVRNNWRPRADRLGAAGQGWGKTRGAVCLGLVSVVGVRTRRVPSLAASGPLTTETLGFRRKEGVSAGADHCNSSVAGASLALAETTASRRKRKLPASGMGSPLASAHGQG
jgi:hypothetical protein